MKSTIIIFLLSLWSWAVFGQFIEPANLITNANYYSSPSNVTLHSSFGEIATETFLEGDVSLSLGFLQTYIVLVPVSEIEQTELNVTVGPIPCANHFTIDKNSNQTLVASLFDPSGHLIMKSTLVDRQTEIDVNHLPAGSYFLKLQDKNQQIFQTIKLIKA